MALRLCRVCEDWHSTNAAWPRECAGHFRVMTYSRSDLPVPMIISDTLHDVVNPLDGKPYDSKSNYYRTVRENDCQILGNETITPRDNDDIPIAPIEAEVAKAFDQLS